MRLYRFLTAPDDATFCKKVSKATSNGWQLYQGPVYSFNAANGQMQCGQAVTKEVEGDYSDDITLSEY